MPYSKPQQSVTEVPMNLNTILLVIKIYVSLLAFVSLERTTLINKTAHEFVTCELYCEDLEILPYLNFF